MASKKPTKKSTKSENRPIVKPKRKPTVITKRKDVVERPPATEQPSVSPAPGSTPKKPEYLIKSPMDSNDYEVIHLENGLKAFLISTCKHELGLGTGKVNPRTGVFAKIEEFNRNFLKIPDESSGNNGDTTSIGDFDNDTNWEPQIKKARINFLEIQNNDEENVEGKEPKIASVSLAIAAGSLHDPPDFPGMAHLLEHACSAYGSKKFPETSLLAEVHKVGGQMNAETIAENTIYMFQLDLNETGMDTFEKLLDMLSDSVENPLLSEHSINKEVHAVDCEFDLQELHDGERMLRLLASCSKESHPFGHFPCGNHETLCKKNLHLKMCDWKQRHYAANYMSLVLKAALPLDDLEKLTYKYFNNIHSSSLPSPMTQILQLHGNPFNTTKFRKIYKVVPITDIQFMFITWVLPKKFTQDYQTKPFVYLGKLLNEDSTLNEYLRQKHWAYEAYGKTPFGTQRNQFCSTFSILVHMTEDGVSNMEQVIKSIFSYIKMITKSKPQANLFNELRREKADVFHYGTTQPVQPKLMDLLYVACNLRHINESKYTLTSSHLITKFNSKLIQECIMGLTPRNMNIIICSKSYKNICTEIEPWHKTKYISNEFTEIFLKQCEDINVYEEFKLPLPNEYHQKNILCPIKSYNKNPLPVFLQHDTKGNVIYVKINLCIPGTIPYGSYDILIASPLIGKTPTYSGMLTIWMEMIQDHLRQLLYRSDKAGIITNLTPRNGNLIRISLIGPPGNHTYILKNIIDTFMNFDTIADEKSFHDYRQLVIKSYTDITLDSGIFAQDLYKFILNQNYLLQDQISSALQNSSFVDFGNYVRSFKDKMFVQAQLVGCISKINATEVADIIKSMDYRELPEIFNEPLRRAMQLPLGERCIRVKANNQLDQTSRVVNHYQFGQIEKFEKTSIEKLVQYLFIPAFNQLRTKEQLSYDIKVYESLYCDVSGLSVSVSPQPHRHTTGYVDERIDIFLQEFRNKFANYDEFFNSTENISLPPCSREEHTLVVQMYDEYLLPTGKSFRKLSIQIVGNLNGDKCNSNNPLEPNDTQDKIEKVLSGMKNVKKFENFNDILPGNKLDPYSKKKITYDVPSNTTYHNGYFITDLDAFKSSLFVYPRES